MINAKIIADSINSRTGDRITTFILPRFPKVLLQELNTHRVFARNAASSRAIPVERVISSLDDDPFIPSFTTAQKGMQGAEANKFVQEEAELVWLRAMDNAITSVRQLLALGIHKQDANRLLEPFNRVPCIITSTKWENFFKLRAHPDAYPAFQEVAAEMLSLYTSSTPEALKPWAWHIPMFTQEMQRFELPEQLCVAVARAARVSYANHDGSQFNLEKDARLHDALRKSGHMSPFEHCAKAIPFRATEDTRNFQGWYSYRAHLEDGRTIA